MRHAAPASGAARGAAGVPGGLRAPAAGVPGGLRARAAFGVPGGLVAVLLLTLAPAAAGQQPVPADEPVAADEPLVRAPFQFRVGPSAGVLMWNGGTQGIDDAGLFGVDLASVVARYLGFRVSGGIGTTAMERGEQRTDAIQYVAEVLVEGRIAVGPLWERGVVPFVAAGGGSVIHDPSESDLVSRSQSAFVWGAGVDVGIADRFGVRAEWRRMTADLQNIFDPPDLEGSTRKADRLIGSLYWAF